MAYHVERFNPSFRHEPNNWGPTTTHAEMLSSSAGNYVRFSDYEALRARLETVEAETRERCAERAESFSLAEHIAFDMREGIFPEQSDRQTAIADAIRNLEPRHD